MICGKLENKLEPKDSFRDHIANYFTELAEIKFNRFAL
jgi:hypothetical protein